MAVYEWGKKGQSALLANSLATPSVLRSSIFRKYVLYAGGLSPAYIKCAVACFGQFSCGFFIVSDFLTGSRQSP